MKIDVPLNVIRLEVNNKTLEEQLNRNDISILNRDDLIRNEATIGLMTEKKAMKDRQEEYLEKEKYRRKKERKIARGSTDF